MGTTHRWLTGIATLALLLSGCGSPGASPLGPAPQLMGAMENPSGVVIPGTRLHLGYILRPHPRFIVPVQPLPVQQLPPVVDLRSLCSPVGDQGQTDGCTGWAIAKGMAEFIENKRGQAFTPLSAEFLYYEERQMEGTTFQDSGVSDIGDGFKVLLDEGVAPEALWPDDAAHLFLAPDPAAIQGALPFRVNHIAAVATVLQSIKATLAQGDGVVLAIAIYDSIKQSFTTGMIPVPTAQDPTDGGHAVFCCGYDDRRQLLILKSSWGTQVGDHGYFYLPYSYVNSQNLWQAYTAD